MNEKLLQHIWNFKVFSHYHFFFDTDGNSVEILDFGTWNTNAGPDFLLAKIKIKNIVFAGNIELHVRSSDWIFHRHSQDPAYENIILHVVYHHDIDIEELQDKKIPTLELKSHIDKNIFPKYEKLLKQSRFIACEEIISPEKIPLHFHEENLLRKLQEKSGEIEKDLIFHKNNYEAVLFHQLAYSFGLKVNADIFKQIAESVDFSIINKIRRNENQLEALLFGKSGWLEKPEDEMMQLWKREYDFILKKYQLPDIAIRPKFLRLRPPNFPTLRLSQLSNLYFSQQNLFSKIISSKKLSEITEIFSSVKASSYWDSHFNFGKKSTANHSKIVSADFIDLLILNAVLPVKYAYGIHHGEKTTDEILEMYKALKPEKNSVTESWRKLGMKIENALESQSFIYQLRYQCERKNCLNCSIGFKILKEL